MRKSILIVEEILNAIGRMIGPIIGGAIRGALSQGISLAQNAFKTAVSFHEESISFARSVGLSYKQAQGYSKALVESTSNLANKYGVTAAAIREVQRNISDATGRQLLLNNAQRESMVQMNKLVGSQVSTQFITEIMTNMGGQFTAYEKALQKTYSTAAKQGLNAEKFTAKVAQNLSMANRLSFRNGVEGIIKMAAMSEKLGINMQSVETAANQFRELDKSIASSAHLQMLGGSAAVYGGNPLTMAYEANYDPEALAERTSQILSSYATFDRNRGIANINGMNMDFVRGIANAMGISVDDASKMAKKQAEVRFKETQFGSDIRSIARGDKDLENYIINNSNFNPTTQRLEVNGKDISSISKKEWDIIKKTSQKSDRELLEDQAKSLISINEQLSGTITTVIASIAKGLDLDENLQKIQKGIQETGTMSKEEFEKFGQSLGDMITSGVKYLKDNKEKIIEGIKSFAKFLKIFTDFASAATNHMVQIIGLLIANSFAKNFGNGGRSIGSPAASGTKNGMLGGSGGGRGGTPSNVDLTNLGSRKTANAKYNYYADQNGMRIRQNIRTGAFETAPAASRGAKNATWSPLNNAMQKGSSPIASGSKNIGNLGRFGKIANGLGRFGGIAGIGGLATSMAGDALAANGSIEKGGLLHGLMSVGGDTVSMAATGAMMGGPWGALIGGAAGLGLGLWNFLSNKENHAQGGIVGGNSPQGDNILVGLNSGEMVLNKTQQANLFNLINGLDGLNSVISSILENKNDVKAKPVGEKEYVYIPQQGSGRPNETSITVKDIKLNVGGTIKLDGGKNSKDIDVNALLNDISFINSLKEIIKQSINNDMNGGRFLNDLATIRGGSQSLNLVGR